MPLALRFPGVSADLHFQDADPVVTGLLSTLNGWRPARRTARGRPLARVIGRGRGFDVDSDLIDTPFEGLSTMSAVNALCADLGESWLLGRGGLLTLHAAAVVMGDAAIAFLGTAGAGKSTLAARLTQEADLRVLADDILPVTAGFGVSGLGIPPRLRLPLPGSATEAFRAHVARNIGLKDGDYAYLSARTVAPHGTTAPLGAIVHLMRQPIGAPRLYRVDPAQAIALILSHNMAPLDPEGAVADHAARLVDQVPLLAMVYSDLEEATAFLRASFVAGVDVQGLDPAPVPSEAPPVWPAVPAAQVYRRAEGTALRQSGGRDWIWQPATAAMFQTNRLSLAIWHLLSEPISPEEAAAALAEFYPEVPAAQIAGDVAALFGALAGHGLIRPVR